MLTQEEIEALPRRSGAGLVGEKRFVGFLFLRKWGVWPITSGQLDRQESRIDGDGCIYYRKRHRVVGLFWMPWKWYMEFEHVGFPWWVCWIQNAQRFIYEKRFSDHTVSFLGARFSWEFLQDWRASRHNWIFWVLAWPLLLFLFLLRKAIR